MGDLTKNFSRNEFACWCRCGADDIDLRLVDYLQSLRDSVGPIKVTSGVRCKLYNAQVGGSDDSAHLSGEAADIHCPSGEFRYDIIHANHHEQFGTLFDRIGIGSDFIHLDISQSKDNDVIWVY